MAFDWFAGLFQRNPNSTTLNEGSFSLLNLSENQMLTMFDCQNIYTFWGLGKRIIHSLPRFAFSAPREIIIQDAPPEAVEEFQKSSENLKQERLIRRVSIFCRIYGMSGLFVAYNPKDDNLNIDELSKENLTIKQVQEGKIGFNALNPLNLSGTVFSQDSTSIKYQKPISIIVKGITVGSKRATVIQNSEPIYLRFTDPTFNFSGTSVFQNMIPLIKAWSRAVISLERMATKASSMVFKEGARGKMTGLMAEAASKALTKIRDMENWGAASIEKDGDVTFFPITGVTEVDNITKSLERMIMMALEDTPSALLLDKDLSNGLSEGTENLKAVIMAVDNFREEVLTPLYALTDPYVMAVAWTDSFINKMIKENGEKYAGFSIQEVRQMWQESFSYEYGNLYPSPEKEVEAKNGIILDNLKKAYDMGADVADIQMEITERKIFKNELELNPREAIEPDPEEMPNAQSISATSKF